MKSIRLSANGFQNSLPGITGKMTLLMVLAIFLFACKKEQKSPSAPPASNPAIEELTQKIAATPSDARLYFARGQEYYRAEGYDEAIADLYKAISLDSSQAAYYHTLSDAYLDYYQSYNALKTMELAAKKFPTGLPTLLKLAELYHILKKYDDSFRTIDQILKQDPQHADAYFLFGLNFKETGDTIRAINSFQSAVEHDADLVDAWIILGQLYARRKDPLAMQYFDNAVRIDSTNLDARHARAVYLNDAGKPQDALEEYRKINRLDYKYQDAYFNAGLIYLELDSVEQAFRQFDMLISVDPIYISAYFYRGLASELKGDFASAKNDYLQTLKFAPDYPKAKEALAALEKKMSQGK
jgi:tetratricopeptide (TPR) repeat protein